MFKQYFLVLLLSHIVGDFYFQTEKMARKKDANFKWLGIHGILYWFSFFVVSIPIFSMMLFQVGIAIAILHMMVDLMKYAILQQVKKKKELSVIKKRNIYLVDQVIHVAVLVVGGYYLAKNNCKIISFEMVGNFFEVIGVSKSKVMNWVTTILIIHKPANITLSHLIGSYRPEINEHQVHLQKDFKAGKFIGTVERIIIVILIFMRQYSAIGLVLTAKSIARYDEIVKHKISAEYYLLGTLISTLIAFLASFFLS